MNPSEMPDTGCIHIINEHTGLVRSIALSYPHCGIDHEDLMQEGFLGLLEAMRHYRVEFQTKFSTYAVFWIKKYILKAIDRELKHRQLSREAATEKACTPLQHPEPLPEMGNPNLAPLQQVLPELELKVLTLSREQGLPMKDISALLGISVERVRQVRQKALRRLNSAAGQ